MMGIWELIEDESGVYMAERTRGSEQGRGIGGLCGVSRAG